MLPLGSSGYTHTAYGLATFQVLHIHTSRVSTVLGQYRCSKHSQGFGFVLFLVAGCSYYFKLCPGDGKPE